MIPHMNDALRQVDALLQQGGGAEGRPPALWTLRHRRPLRRPVDLEPLRGGGVHQRGLPRVPRDGALWGGMVKWPVAAPASRWIGAEGTLVTTERTLRADPSVETWGTPRRTGIQSPFLGEYLFISFPLDRLRGVMPRREFQAAPPRQ